MSIEVFESEDIGSAFIVYPYILKHSGKLTFEFEEETNFLRIEVETEVENLCCGNTTEELLFRLGIKEVDQLYRYLGLNNGRAERCRSLPIE